MKTTLTGFFDHNQETFEEQLAYAKSFQISTICLKLYNKKPIIEISDHDIKDILTILKTEKAKIAAIDTGIKPYDIHSQQKFENALDEFKHILKIADKLKVSHLFLELPIFTDVIQEFEMIKNRFEPFVDSALKLNKKIILVPGNSYKANTYIYIIKKLKTNNVSVLFDPVYLMMNNESTTTSYRLFKGNISAIKAVDANQQGIPKLMGYGKSDVVTIMKKLIRDKYDGLIMMDNQFHTTVFKTETKKKGFFSKIFSNEEKNKQKSLSDLSKIIFPKEEIKNVTYDDILENQIKIMNVIFK